MPLEEKPMNPVSSTYAPPGTRHEVKNGESWMSIAQLHGLDAWDLIDFNFPGIKDAKQTDFQRAARYVNWYLREYVGCQASLDGGRNWAFTSGLTKGQGAWKGGVIYIPRRTPEPPAAPLNCMLHPLNPIKIVAIATDKYLTATHSSIAAEIPGPAPKYGQDFTFGVGRAAPGGQSVGNSPADLKPKMEKLVSIFASEDKTGMAKRLFAKFLAKQPTIYYFEDSDLNTKAANHENVKFFCGAALGAPAPLGTPPPPGKTRIHQSLKAAKWDVTKMTAPTDLGVPAFNRGSPTWRTKDFSNGLGVMINGVQHVYVMATHYNYDRGSNWYCINLKYVLYDVFGLDDDDLKEFGAAADSWHSSDAAIGITAWWQLQHQHGYAPLVTRIVVNKSFVVPAT